MKVRKCDIVILLFVFFSGALLVCTSEYVQWTAYASAIIDGVQGRYFTPVIIFPMLAFVLVNSKKERKNKNGNGYVSYGKYFYILVLALNGIGILDIIHYYL